MEIKPHVKLTTVDGITSEPRFVAPDPEVAEKRSIAAAEKLSSTVGKKSACQALQVARATF